MWCVDCGVRGCEICGGCGVAGVGDGCGVAVMGM